MADEMTQDEQDMQDVSEGYRPLKEPGKLTLDLGDFEELQGEKKGMDVQLTVKGTVESMDDGSITLTLDEANVLHGSKLSYKERKGLSRSSFAIPEKRAYPIHDEAHARNALSRVSAYGSPEEKSRVRAAVHKKFPAIGSSQKKKMFGGG